MTDLEKILLGIGAAGGLYGLYNMNQSPEGLLASESEEYVDAPVDEDPWPKVNPFGRSDPLSAYPFARQSTFPEMGSTTDLTERIPRYSPDEMGIMVDGMEIPHFYPSGLERDMPEWMAEEGPQFPHYNRRYRELTAPIAGQELPDPGYFRGNVAPNPHSGYMPPTLDEYRMMQGIHGNPNLWNMR